MKIVLVSSIALLAAMSVLGPATAADKKLEPRKTRTAPEQTQSQSQSSNQSQSQSTNWSGGQVGGSNGLSSVNNNFVEPGAYNYFGCAFGCYETPFNFNDRSSSYIIGAFAGYRQQFGMIVLGIEGDFAWHQGETSKTQQTPPPWLPYESFSGSLKQGVDGSFRGRAGYLVTPMTLLYATGGLAIGNVSGSFSYAGCSTITCAPGGVNVTGAMNWSDTLVGYTVGGGVETEVFKGIKLRLEYRYTDYGTVSKDVPLDYPIGCPSTVCGSVAHIDLHPTNQRFLVGLGFDL